MAIHNKSLHNHALMSLNMILIMLDIARTSLKMLGTDLFEQLSQRS